MRHSKTLALDFDGTIAEDNKFGNGSLANILPNPNAQRAVTKLYGRYNIVIFTVRVSPQWEDWEEQVIQLEAWLKENNIPYDDITSDKPKAVAYIDDKAIRFTNWTDIENYYV